MHYTDFYTVKHTANLLLNNRTESYKQNQNPPTLTVPSFRRPGSIRQVFPHTTWLYFYRNICTAFSSEPYLPAKKSHPWSSHSTDCLYLQAVCKNLRNEYIYMSEFLSANMTELTQTADNHDREPERRVFRYIRSADIRVFRFRPQDMSALQHISKRQNYVRVRPVFLFRICRRKTQKYTLPEQ